MLDISEKCTQYNDVVKKQKNSKLIKFALSLLLIIAAVAVIVLLYAKNLTVGLIIAAILIVGVFVVRLLINNQFLANNKKIIEIFNKYYGLTGGVTPITFIRDNYSLVDTIAKNGAPAPLLCYMEKESLSFVTAQINNIENMKAFTAEYSACLNADFGKLTIAISSIDSYRAENKECVMVVNDRDIIRRLRFSDDRAFDNYIPNLEYYYTTAKKQ